MPPSSPHHRPRLADALDSDAAGVPDRLLRALHEAMGKQPSTVLQQESKVRKARAVWTTICHHTDALASLLEGHPSECWSIRGRAEDLVHRSVEDPTLIQNTADVRGRLQTLQDREDELVLLLTTFVVRYARSKSGPSDDPAAVVAAGLKVVAEAAYQCRGLPSLDFASELLVPTQRAILAACGTPPGRHDDKPLGTTAALERLEMAIDRRSLGRLRGGPIIVPHSRAGRTRLHRFGATWPVDRYRVPEDLDQADEPPDPHRHLFDREPRSRHRPRRRGQEPATNESHHALSAALLQHQHTIREGLRQVTVEGLGDWEAIIANLQDAAEHWARMSGRSMRAYAHDWIYVWWFASPMEPMDDTATIRPWDEPPGNVAPPTLPRSPAHPREEALIEALIPYTVHRACVNLRPHDSIENLVMDGICALIAAAREYDCRGRGDLTWSILLHIEGGVFQSTGAWRTCDETAQAFLPFPDAIHDAVLATCLNRETIHQLIRKKLAASTLPAHVPTATAATITIAEPPTMDPTPLPRVLRLLHRATDLKLLARRTQHALSMLAEADALCDDHPELPRAIQGLVAYRMGHLRMRQAPDVPTLLDAERDFQRACRLGEGLEPWAGLYHLAVLGRLAASRPHADIPDDIQDRLTSRWQQVIQQQSTLDPTQVPDRDDPIVQRGSLNATEALGYALGLPQEDLEGLGSLQHALHLDQDWGVLVGPELTDTHVRLPWEILPTTLHQMRLRHPSAIAFSLPGPGKTPQLWRPHYTLPEPISRQQAALLAWVLQGHPDGTAGLDHRVWGRPVAASTRRKLVQRTRTLLVRILEQPGETLLPRDVTGLPQLAPHVVVYGAVHGENLGHG